MEGPIECNFQCHFFLSMYVYTLSIENHVQMIKDKITELEGVSWVIQFSPLLLQANIYPITPYTVL